MADPFRRCFGEAGDEVEDEGAGEEEEDAGEEEEDAGEEEEDAGECVAFSSSIRFSAWANFSCCMSVTFALLLKFQPSLLLIGLFWGLPTYPTYLPMTT